MKKPNVSSEVLILLKNREKNVPEWTPKNSEKDECFERGLDFEVKKGGRQQPPAAASSHFGVHFGIHFGSLFHHFWDNFLNQFLEPFWHHFGAILEPILEPDRPKGQARPAKGCHQELQRAKKLHFQKP